MNLRIGEKSLRFRIGKEELELLLDGEPVGVILPFFMQDFHCGITPSDTGQSMHVELSGNAITLIASKNILHDLRALGRSKQGVNVTQGALSVMLQLDIKTMARITP